MATVNRIQSAHDRKLVKKLLAGDQRAFTDFTDQYLPKLYRYAYSRLRDEDIVEEVLQLTLSAVAKYLKSFRGEATLLTWLIQILRHETSRYLAKNDRYESLIQRWHDDEALQAVIHSHAAPISQNPDQLHAQAQLATLIQDILDQLPENYAQALELKYVQEKASKDIADALNISDQAAQSLLARARRAFKELCDDSVHTLMRHNTMDAPGGGPLNER